MKELKELKQLLIDLAKEFIEEPIMFVLFRLLPICIAIAIIKFLVTEIL